jgi:hypothetical protein
MSLTGDELTLNDKSYSITDKNGNEFNLGKLIKREKFYSPFHESYSSYNNIFEFENMPDKSLVPNGVTDYYKTKKFTEVTVIPSPSLSIGSKHSKPSRSPSPLPSHLPSRSRSRSPSPLPSQSRSRAHASPGKRKRERVKVGLKHGHLQN